jgi:GAF domain-containing protein
MREFSSLIPSGQQLEERLNVLLQVLCNTLGVSKGFVALREGDDFIIIAEAGVTADFESMDLKAFIADEITQISSLIDMPDTCTNGLIVPLLFGGIQIGIVIIGEKDLDSGYSEDDIHLLEDLAEIVAAVIHTSKLQESSVEQIGMLLGEIRNQDQQILWKMKEAMGDEDDITRVLAESEPEAVALVEDALRHLHDFSYLGRQPLASLLIVPSHLDVEETEVVTHVDRGKALKETLLIALNKLMPSTARGSGPPPREWHSYIILHDCYFLEKLNREVMSELYISEGTFNRTRRRALRGMTRALAEMEMNILMDTLGKTAPS